MAINSEWFYRRLEERGASARALADFLNLDPSSVSRMLKGERKMSAEEQDGIAAYLGVSLDVVAMRRRGEGAGFAEEGQEALDIAAHLAGDPRAGMRNNNVGRGESKERVAAEARHPIFGCMKGTMTIPDDLDLTAPVDPDWAKVYDDD